MPKYALESDGGDVNVVIMDDDGDRPGEVIIAGGATEKEALGMGIAWLVGIAIMMVLHYVRAKDPA